MNAVTRIIDYYFRHVRGCFTMPDVRILKEAFCRSADLLAYNISTKEQFHIENAVTHSQLWPFSPDNLHDLFDKSFLRHPGKRVGKYYFKEILKTYRGLGFSPSKVKRIFVIWCIKPGVDVKAVSDSYYKKRRIRVEVMSFRDRILSDLQEKVAGSVSHDDEALRILSLVAQREIQTKKEARSQTALNTES